MPALTETPREGNLDAPTRHPINWQNPAFYDETSLYGELDRVFEICHGCRRCFSLCNSFPTLFDAIDASPTLELDGVDKKVFWQVVDHCYLCDMCYMTKCPYVPPHPWNVDFPHLMLRAKAVHFKKHGASIRDRVLTSTDSVGRLAGIPIVVNLVNAVNHSKAGRALLDKTLGVHPNAPVPEYYSDTFRKRAMRRTERATAVVPAGRTRGKVALFTTCYGNYNEPRLGEDLISVLEHNGITVHVAQQEVCCGMPKLELGDLDAVRRLKESNIPALARLVEAGWDLVAPIPSCVLMFKQELPLLFPDDAEVQKVRAAFYDPFEYLMLRHKDGKLNTEFKQSLGRVSYHVACHLRVQNIGMKTRDVLQLIPGTQVEAIERCSGHDGTYSVKSEFHETSMKICKPVASRVDKSAADHYGSDCPMAGHQIETALGGGRQAEHPLALLRKAYGI